MLSLFMDWPRGFVKHKQGQIMEGLSLMLNRGHVSLEDMLYFFENLGVIQELLNI